jgi:hypothetical protein
LHFDWSGQELDSSNIHATTSIDNYPYTEPSPYLSTFDKVPVYQTHKEQIMATSSSVHRTNIPIDVLARGWGPSITTSKATLDSTTQRGLAFREKHYLEVPQQLSKHYNVY